MKSIRMNIIQFLMFVFIASLSLVSANGEDRVYVKAYYPNKKIAQRVIHTFEPAPPAVDYTNGFVVMYVNVSDRERLTNMGFAFEPYPEYSPFHTRSGEFSDKAIPGYVCYPTVEDTFSEANNLATANPQLVTWINKGDSWQKANGHGGYNMMVLKITNSSIGGNKPKLFITSAIHAREYATSPLALGFAKELINGYHTNPDIRWILDYHEIHLMLHANPDGRKQAEKGSYWRKNTNQDCGASSSDRGTDLNRNFAFHWGGQGSSNIPCDETYRGTSAASEPEVKAIQDYIKAIFPDYNGNDPNNGAPDDAAGLFIDLHSYSELVLWPWGDTDQTAPNGAALKTLGHKFAYFNGYTPQQSIELYPTTGTTDDYAYGELGVAAYCFEIGTDFFQSCSTFQSTIFPDNLKALMYAAKVCRAPYQIPYGPDALNLSMNGTKLTATIDSSRYSVGITTYPIAQAEYYIDTPPWVAGAISIPMSASDGSFNSKIESVTATLSTSAMSTGEHIIYVRGKDNGGHWGPVSAMFYSGGGSNTYPLTVEGGSGSDNYTAGATVTITANPAPAGQVFNQWVAHAGNPTIANVTSPTTTLTMPANAASVTATYTSTNPNQFNEGESNDSISTANAVPDTATKIIATIGSSSDKDYFKVNVGAGATLKVDMTGPNVDYELFLYNSAGTLLRSSTGSSCNESVTYKNTGSSAVNYIIRIEGYNGAHSTTPYNLALTKTGTPGSVSVTINPTTASIDASTTKQFAATVTGTTNTAVTWSCTGGGTVNNGLYTAPSTACTATVKATSAADSTKSATATITVTSGGGSAVITASGENPPHETKEKAFDGSTATKWLTFEDSGWIQYQFAGNTTKVIKSYSITSANDFPERDPRDWSLRGSNNGSTWTTLDTRSGVTFTSRFQKRTFSFSNTTAYQMYRLDITSNFYPALANSTQLSEFELTENAGPTTYALTVNSGSDGHSDDSTGPFCQALD